jgi:hypothetical protein
MLNGRMFYFTSNATINTDFVLLEEIKVSKDKGKEKKLDKR